MADFTPHQKKIVDRYYENRDQIMLAKLQEIVTELYLADSDTKRKRLWDRAGKAMKSLGIKEAAIEHVLGKQDPEVLARHIREWTRKPPS
ncbi:MAG: hypothetical protein ACPGXK_04170 [Phycisphaerae bacterium]